MVTAALFDEQLRPAFDLMQHGLALVDAAADDRHRADVEAAIETLAGSGRWFSANDIRPLVPHVPPKLIAPRLEAARKAGLIRKVEQDGLPVTVPSTLRSTHGKPLQVWIGA